MRAATAATWVTAPTAPATTKADRILTPVTEVKRRATEIIGRLQEDRVPVLVTERGRSAAVMLAVETYEGLLDQLAILQGVARGERAFAEGRVVSHKNAKKRLSKWLDEPR
jgi:prevent-host-death family protein